MSTLGSAQVRAPGRATLRRPAVPASPGAPRREEFRLRDGSGVGIVGGGPAGSFFGYFLLQMASRVGLRLNVDIHEPRDFSIAGPRGCNMCGGIVSESLVQSLAAEGIHFPLDVIQRRIDSYFLHMDVGDVRIETPLQEKRIAAVHRGSGPRGVQVPTGQSFDSYLLDLAVRTGARLHREKVDRIEEDSGFPVVISAGGEARPYDLLAIAVGVNGTSPILDGFPRLAYRPPRSTRAYICEFFLGADTIRRHLGSSMHIFLLNIPRLDFAAVIPKTDYVTVCLLGRDIDKELVRQFLDSAELRRCMPPNWTLPDDYCRCSPRMNVGAALEPYGDRIVFVGDCGTTRLFKDGIGAAYRSAKAAAVTAVFEGVSRESFVKHYAPACKLIEADNRIGRFVFGVTRAIQRTPFARRGLWRMVSLEQRRSSRSKAMSTVLWDTFTGSAPYGKVLRRTVHPLFLSRFLWNIASGIVSPAGRTKKEKLPMATGASGLMGKQYHEGEIIYRQGERGDSMFVVQGGRVEIVQRRGEREIVLASLGDGDFFGEMALFGEETRMATVRALEDVWIFTLEKTGLLRRIHEDPSLAFRIIERMAHRIRELENSLAEQRERAT